MKRIIIFFIMIYGSLTAISRTVALDGTMMYSSINTAINEATDGDTILVYPGHYTENVDFLGKSLCLTSLYEQTGNDTIRYRTVIDGNYSGSCIKIIESRNAIVSGFRIINGTGFDGFYMSGGGIFAKDSNLCLKKCLIENNSGTAGAGIRTSGGQIEFIGNTIRNNKALRGGGICMSNSFEPICNVVFSQTELNSVYNNDANNGADILFAYMYNVVAYLDTFTVAVPSNYYFRGDRYGQVIPLHGVLEPIEADVYVAPWGDDSNSGLSAEEPFKTIKQANRMIYGDSLNIRTIHLAEGIYSASTNGEELPLNIQGYVHWQGAGKNQTIIDGEDLNPIIMILDWQKSGYFKMSSMTCRNSFYFNQGTIFTLGGYAEISKVDFLDYKCSPTFLIMAVVFRATSGKIENTNIMGTRYGYGLNVLNDKYFTNPNDLKVNIVNCKIKDNIYDPAEDPLWAHGGGIYLLSNDSERYENFSVINCEITENANGHIEGPRGGVSGIVIDEVANAKIINCTISKNRHRQNQGGAVSNSNSNLYVYNTIIFNNEACELDCNPETQVYIKNSIIGEGLPGDIYNVNNNITWLSPNIIQNPRFDSLNTAYPYSLQSGSPCINAGTLDLPEGVELPALDLAGNPRINDGMIDIGAYEYQGTPIIEEELPEIITNKVLLYPNPFRDMLSIKVNSIEEGKSEIAIYNIKGQKVSTLFSGDIAKGKYNFQWDGKNDEGKKIATGHYFVKFKIKDREIVRKVLMIK